MLRRIFFQKKKPQDKDFLVRIDKNKIPQNSKEIRLFSILRNESLRLPYFIKYYQSLGVDRFFFIDNNSSDSSQKIILNEPNVHLFYTEESYTNHWYWMEYLLEMYGKDQWCLVVDIDELFTYPNIESNPLPRLVKYLEEKKFTSVNSILLDMYSSNAINKGNISCKDNPLDILNYFDTNYYKVHFSFYDRKNNTPVIAQAFTGGMRERVFGKMKPLDILSKVPLFKFEKNVYLLQGMHAISNTTPADIEGVVFHTKFLNDFLEEVREEAKREQHWDNAIRYKHYEKTIDEQPNLSLFYEKSIKFTNNAQLIDLELMRTSENFEFFCNEVKEDKN